LTILGICTSTLLSAQQASDYRFVNFGYKDGLQERVVHNAVQDKRGYMWFGTGNGLYRYDGHHFKYFRSPLDKAGSSIGNVLQGIMCDKKGNLWLGSLTDLQWYNPEKNIFWETDKSNPVIKTMAASYFYGFSEGDFIWLSTAKNYVYRFNSKDSSFLSLAPQYPAGASVTSLKTAEVNGKLYDLHPEGMYIFSAEGRFLRYIPHKPRDITNGTYDQQDNCMYVSTYKNGMLRFDISGETFSVAHEQNETLKKNNLYAVVKDKSGSFYMGAGSLLLLNPSKEKVIDFFTADKSNEFNLAAQKIVNIIPDREGNMWICSHNGLSMLPWQNNQVRTILLKDENTGYTTEPIGVYQEPGTRNYLIINTTSLGLQHVDYISGKVTTIKNNVETAKDKKRITALITAPDSTMFASDGKNLFRYNSVSKSLIPVKLSDQNGKPLYAPTRGTLDKRGTIFIGSLNNGFYKWEYYTGKLTHYNKWEVTSTDAANSDNILIPCITDSRENIWFTGSNGVYEYRQEEGKYYHHTPSGKQDMPDMGSSMFIAEDKQGHFWITTQNNGLYELWFENKEPIWRNYTVNSGIGLPSDYCSKIKQSPLDSCLWLNNTGGLLRFDPFEKKVKSIITMQNGLYSHGFGYTFNLFPDKTLAQLFYGAINIIDLSAYRFNDFKPVVVFNAVKVLNREYAYNLPAPTTPIIVPNNQNFLQLEFVSLLYNNAGQVRYAYRLDGANNDWVFSGQTNTVAYSGLKPGNYTFRVKAANNDGVWGEESVLHIRIKGPFYAQWWFLLLLAGFAALLVGWWNRIRVAQATKEEKLKAAFQQQIAQTEMKALRAQMNPHFIFNSLNSIQKYILKKEHFEASQYLTKFSRLIRLILDHSNQSTIALSSELELLKLYIEMESLRFDNKFDYKIFTDNGLQPDTVEIPSMLVQPYVENAIWHGLLHKETKGILILSFEKNDAGSLIVTIEDDGIGRDKAAELKSKQVLKKKSYGMQITEDRIAIINRIQNMNATSEIEDLIDENGNATGTRVTLNIPLIPLTA
jgi:ligand-binding sensor domain-containing protein/two-component sensor histidine kinase